MTRSTRTSPAATALAFLMSLGAHAHHAMDYQAPANLFEGFVSGLAHPVIGLDHLLFVIAIGAACYFFGRRGASPTLHRRHDRRNRAASPPSVPFHEVGVAATLVLLGVLLIAGQHVLKTRAALLLFCLAGLVYGGRATPRVTLGARGSRMGRRAT